MIEAHPIAIQHDELEKRCQLLLSLLEDERSDGPLSKTIAAQFLALADLLLAHLSVETDAWFAEIIRVAPHLAYRVAVHKAEHSAFAEEMTALCEVLRSADLERDEKAMIFDRMTALIEALLRHETEEQAMLRTYKEPLAEPY